MQTTGDKEELNGGRQTSTANNVHAPTTPTRRLRSLSFRRKKRIEPSAAATKRRISFKSVALTIQKWLIRASVPKVETTSNCVQESPAIVQSKPNWSSVFSGIQNHGNTCFLNAIIQCLSHTDLLAKYLVLDHYKADLSSSQKTGEVTQRLAMLIKSLWTSRYSAEISNGFKKIVSKHGVQYRGTLQHDAQEFMLWLLDAVHEDLNVPSKKKRHEMLRLVSRDKIIDYSAIENYIANNKSFILDVFQGLQSSTLTCPHCCKRSVTFDPYLSLSIPIPQRTTCAVCLTFIRADSCKRHIQLAVSVHIKSTVHNLLNIVAKMLNVATETLILTELYTDGFKRTFSNNHMTVDIHNAPNLFVFEISGFNHYEKPTLLMQSLFPRLPNVAILVVNCQLLNNGRLRRFGSPYSVRVLKELSYSQLQEAIFKANPNIRHSKRPDGNVFGLRVCSVNSRCSGTNYLTPEVDHPLYQSIIEEAIKSSNNGSGPPHVKMIAEWSKEAKEMYLNFDANDELYDLHPSVEEVDKIYKKPWSVTLDQCLKLYTQQEQLNIEDAWLCSNCKELQHGATKQLHLHTIPDVLIIHLKRFKQLRSGRSKLHLLVDFPVTGLNLAPFMDVTTMFKDDPPEISAKRKQDNLYDLYAVCNHLGTMMAGHYTATCKNPVDGKWYSYDDSQVARIPEIDIVTNSAYLLFYVRRSSDTSTFLGSPEHWVFNVSKASLENSDVSHEDNDNDVSAIEDVSTPDLAEYYVTRKLQNSCEKPETVCHIMSESCV